MGTRKGARSRSGRGRLAALARHLIDEATAQFLETGEPEDLHAALRASGVLVLDSPEVRARLSRWREILLLAQMFPELWTEPGSRAAVRGLMGIGRALTPARRPGRPRRPRRDISVYTAWIKQQHAALVAAIRGFRTSCAARRERAYKTERWWRALPKDEADALLMSCGFPPELAEVVASINPKRLLPGGGEPARLAVDLVCTLSVVLPDGPRLSPPEVRTALRRRKKSERKP